MNDTGEAEPLHWLPDYADIQSKVKEITIPQTRAASMT